MEGEARGANSGYQRELLQCMSPLMAHRDRSHFGGRTSLSGHNGLRQQIYGFTA
jgi:hypothetical protein